MIKIKLIGILFFAIAITTAQEQELRVSLDAFDIVKGFDGISINLIKSKENKAVITGKRVHKVAIVNRNGTLKVRMQVDKIFKGYDTFVDLYYTANLKIIDANEEARIISEEMLNAEVLDLRAQEGGKLDFKCNTQQLLVRSITGGNIKVEGKTVTQDIKINTGGRYNGKGFESNYTTVSVNAVGHAQVYANNYVKADVKAGGTVAVFGNPKRMDEKTVLGGTVERIE
ncbi:MAG: head GIN domain-containing protein [Bacteroidota bacterium]